MAKDLGTRKTNNAVELVNLLHTRVVLCSNLQTETNYPGWEF